MGFLQPINDLLVQYLGPLGPIIVVGVLGIVIVAITISMMLAQPEDPLDKLKKSAARQGTALVPQREQLRQGGRNEQLEKFSKFLEPQDVAEMSKLELTMRQAGYSSKDSVRMFHAAQFILGIAGLILGTVYVMFFLGDDAGTNTGSPNASKSGARRSPRAFPTVSTCCLSASKPVNQWIRRLPAWPKNCAPPARHWRMSLRWCPTK